jgi:hypothetical protein
MSKRLSRNRTRFTSSVSVSFRIGAAVDVIAEITNQNKKDVANALIWKGLEDDPEMLRAVLAILPEEQAAEPCERSTIRWGRDAAGMSEAEKAAVLESAHRQSFRITDVLIKLDERKRSLVECEVTQ